MTALYPSRTLRAVTEKFSSQKAKSGSNCFMWVNWETASVAVCATISSGPISKPSASAIFFPAGIAALPKGLSG